MDGSRDFIWAFKIEGDAGFRYFFAFTFSKCKGIPGMI